MTAPRHWIIGRDPRCHQVLNHPLISARHARLTRGHDGFWLEDLGSLNGTFVNGRRITTAVRVRRGDVIGLAGFTLTLDESGRLVERDLGGKVTLEALNVSVAASGRQLLDAISLTIFPAEMVGLMGPSGAGKTTLLNALNGYAPPSTGAVLLNGKDIYEHYDQFRTALGYLAQDDLIHPDLTVHQALYYSARLRLPPDFSAAELETRIQTVLKQLGLESAANVLIGSPNRKGISGGERKRVNLAMELLTDPLVLFLDEPTSGLSSEDAFMVMKVLRGLADAGKTILLTIHQPSLEVFRLLDNAVVLARDTRTAEPGRLVYYGPAYPDAIQFCNPNGSPPDQPNNGADPDAILRGLSRRRADEWAEAYRHSPFYQHYVVQRARWSGAADAAREGAAASEPVRRSSLLFQWWTLTARCLTIKRKDTINTFILLAQAPVAAVLIVLVFGRQLREPVTAENWPRIADSLGISVFVMTLAALWFGASNAVREIVGEWPIYHRERMVSLKIPSYVASKFTVLGLLCIVQCLVLLGITRWGCALQSPWWPTFGLLLLTALCGVAVGLCLSALARTSEAAIALLPIVLLVLAILEGMMQPIHRMPRFLQTLCKIIPSRWAFEGMILLESAHRPQEPPPLEPVPSPVVELPHLRDMAELYFPRESERRSVPICAAALAFLILLLNGLIHVILRLRDVY
jgi:ABC-type multidrug transport system ATPase subunit